MGKKKTTSTQTQNTVSTPTNPAWVESGMEGLAGKIADFGNRDPYSLVAGADPLQTQAAAGASQLGSMFRPTQPPAATGVNQFGLPLTKSGAMADGGGAMPGPSQWETLMGAEAPQVQGASLLDNLSSYMSPYTNDVVNTTLAGVDHNAGMTRAQQALDMTGAKAFGGSGSAITRSMTEEGLARTRAETEAGLRDRAFTTGAGLSNSDAGRRQDASSQNAQLALQDRLSKIQSMFDLNSSNRADVALQGDLGAQQRAIAQQQASAPANQLSLETGLFGSLPTNLLHGGTTNSTGTTTSTTPGLTPFDWFTNNMALAGQALSGLGGK